MISFAHRFRRFISNSQALWRGRLFIVEKNYFPPRSSVLGEKVIANLDTGAFVGVVEIDVTGKDL